jgi:hypothetical protein
MLIEEKELVITNVTTLTKMAAAFAWTEEQEDVFISRDVIAAFGSDLVAGDLVKAVVIPNRWDKRERTPYKCIRISSRLSDTPETIVPDPEPVVEIPPLRDLIHDLMCEYENEFFSVEDMSHQEIYEHHPRTGREEVRVALDSLHTAGLICKAAVFSPTNQSHKASFNLYSKDISAFEWGVR